MSADTEARPLFDSGLPQKSYGSSDGKVVPTSGFDEPDTNASLSFHGITYTITPLLSRRKEPSKVILSDCR